MAETTIDDKDTNIGEPGGEGTADTTSTPPVDPVTNQRRGNAKPVAEDLGDETVNMPKKTLDAILTRLDKQDQEIEVLREASDTARLSKAEQARNQGKLVKDARVTMYDGKFVLGWQMVKDEVRFEEEKLIEVQTVALFFEDKSKKEVSYRAFTNGSTKVKGEVISESRDKEGQTFVTLQLADGHEIPISTTFIN